MPFLDVVIVSLITGVFVGFGAVLAGICWYCRGQPVGGDGRLTSPSTAANDE